MSDTKHLLKEYSSNLLNYGNQDPITRLPFITGDPVILCKETNNLISLRSLQGNNYECPHCNTRLNPDLTHFGPVKLPPTEKNKPNPVPTRPTYNSTVLWGGLAAFMLLCFIAAALGIFGSLGAITTTATEGISIPPTYTQVRSTPTYIPSQPFPTPTTRSTAKLISPTSDQSTNSSPSCSGITVSSNKTSNGTILHVTLCSGLDYDLGPLANGAYIVDPNDKFLVYVSGSDGTVYIAKIGDTSFMTLGNLKRDHGFSAFYKDETPSFRLSISGSSLIIHEEKFNQEASYSIPSWAR